jgi:diguanylate cyclase (GGDEF)-like protein
MSSPFNNKRFISIRWKYFIAFSIVLLTVNFGLSLQSSHSLKQQFEQHQSEISQQNRHQLSGLLNSSFELLTQSAYNIHYSLGNELATQAERMEHKKLDFLDTYELEEIIFIPSKSNNKLIDLESLPDNFNDKLEKAFASEMAINGLFCTQNCKLYSLVPLLQPDKSTAILYISKSIAELLQNFFMISSNDIGIVNLQNQTIFAASNSQKTSGLLKHALDSIHILKPGQHLDWNAETYNLQYLDKPFKHQDFRFVIVANITKNLDTIEVSTSFSLFYGLLGLITSLVVLLLLMSKPVARIVSLSQNLPLLSSNRHDVFKAKYPTEQEKVLLRDELDLLESTSMRLADQLQKSETELIWQAEHDSLTGLKNRHRFRQDFQQILKNSKRFGHEGALLYFDLDQFKYVNDTSGHQTGDILLKLVADQIKKTIRSTDICARLGGDEFALILPETEKDGAIKLADKIQEMLAEISLPSEEYVHRTSASIGIVMFPTYGDNVEELVSNGDIAMYHAKDNGRGNTYLFSDSNSTREQFQQRLRWKDIIESALNEKRLTLYFQPILDTRSNTISHHEALLRVIQDDGEILPPGTFIAEAEQAGLINLIDYHVLELALQYLSKHSDSVNKIAVNLSGKTINDENLVSHIIKLLSTYQVAPESIIFEITETAAVADILVASKIMKDINSIGCQFALDDFGIGFSSFYYLKQLPAQYIKIDGAFIRNITSNLDDQLFVQAISTVSSGLGKKTVAEFVENQEALDLIRKYGVDYAQGYHIGKPQAEPQTSFHK